MTEEHHHRRWYWVLAGVVLALVLLGGALALFTHPREPGEASLDKAVESFRETTTLLGPTMATRPPAGVYTATGSGKEKLSFQTGSQSIGPSLPVVVTYPSENCFTVRLDYNANHWQTWDYCDQDGQLVNKGGIVYQNFDFGVAQLGATGTSVCDPVALVLKPDMAPGDQWDQSCVSTTDQSSGSTTSAGPHEIIASETVEIAGTPVAAWHTRDTRTVTGDQQGSSTTDFWFAADSGMMLKAKWTLSLDSDSIIGSVTYTEDGEWLLDTLTPQS